MVNLKPRIGISDRHAHGSKQRIMTLDAVEFLRRFLPPRAAQRLRANPPFRAALQPFPKPEPDDGTKAAGSRWLPLASATAVQNLSSQPNPLVLSRMRRSHVCGAKTDCRRAIPIKSFRFVMTLNTNPDPRLAPRTPTHSCPELIPSAHLIALLQPNLALDKRQLIPGPTTFHQHRSRFMHSRTFTHIPKPHSISIDPGRSPRPLRKAAPSFYAPYRNRLESSSSPPLTFRSRRFRSG